MKSHVSDLEAVAVNVYLDATAKCAAEQQGRDLKTLRSRIEHEGLSFLTITLPSMGKDFEQALSLGSIEPTMFRAFRKIGRIPAFLQGIFALVFDKTEGRLLDDPNLAAIEGIRQIAYTFKKLSLSCTPSRVRKAIDEFLQCELDLNEPLDPTDLAAFAAVSSCIWPYVLGVRISNDSGNPLHLKPKHGPGATCERISGNQKYIHRTWHDRLEPYFPMTHFAFSSENACESKEFESIQTISPEQELPVRVITVPKTLKSPRIIAIEPVCMQYAQQAVSRWLTHTIERDKVLGGLINFTDQSINQRLAMMSSSTGKLATLDLSSASDRVPYSLAISMFDSAPDIRDAISACRSTRAKLPTGEIITLKKFASMGSALCFPVESMYFYTICVMALLENRHLPRTRTNVLKVAHLVHVYGDDIIVPTDDAASVIDHLQKYYCKVNVSKSFWTGKFRESCGTDAYDGEEVVPTYLRQMPPNNRRDTKSLISWVEASNLFYRRGYWRTANLLIKQCETIIGALPIVGPKCSGLGKVSFQHLVSTERWNCRFQVPEVRTWCAAPVYRNDRLDGYPALMKCLLRLEGGIEPLQIDGQHLMRSARYGAVALKRRWIRPY